MKVKELISALEEFDGELEVGGSGHFGELLEIYLVHKKGTFVCLDMDSAGDEPD